MPRPPAWWHACTGPAADLRSGHTCGSSCGVQSHVSLPSPTLRRQGWAATRAAVRPRRSPAASQQDQPPGEAQPDEPLPAELRNSLLAGLPDSLLSEASTLITGEAFDWATQEAALEGPDCVLPLMALGKAKVPLEVLPLQLFEPRYRLMFKLVARSPARRFGVVWADRPSGLDAAVGCVCELTHFVPVPERRRIFVVARAVGRFRVQRVISDQPFVTAHVEEHSDLPPEDISSAAQAAALEMRVWQCMQDVRALAAKLFATSGATLGDEVFSADVRRWCPAPSVLAPASRAAAAGEAEVLEAARAAGLLGSEASLAGRLRAWAPSLAGQQAVPDALRRERFSFAVARTIEELGPADLQQLLDLQDTSARLRRIEAALLEGRRYLAARSALRNLF